MDFGDIFTKNDPKKDLGPFLIKNDERTRVRHFLNYNYPIMGLRPLVTKKTYNLCLHTHFAQT